MKIINLYLLIYNRNEMPEAIKYDGIEYKWNEKHKDYMARGGLLFLHNRTPFDLDDTVEILEEENKIPEKLSIGLKQTKDGIFNTIVKDDIQYELNEKEEMICKKIHEIIDYLKNKGE